MIHVCAGVVWMMSAGLLGEISVEDFDDIQKYRLSNRQGMMVEVTNYGAIITSIMVPDRNKKLADVALGHDRLEGYMNAVDRPYFGAVVGRYANRIARGTFTLDGKAYKLAVNNGENHLHGGIIGFDKVVWGARPLKEAELSPPAAASLELSYRAKDMEEGYPGNLDVTVRYTLTQENELICEYRAKTDRKTHVNLTQHTYFNLKGEGEGNVLDHELQIFADSYTPVNAQQIPTGKIDSVEGTPFDFRQLKKIGRDIESPHEQVTLGKGFDHNWVLSPAKVKGERVLAARVVEPSTGRVLEVRTTEPGLQFYCGNFLDGRLKGKSGKAYLHRGGFCLETQHYPDSPNQPTFPSTVLEPGQEYHTTTSFRFSTDR